jgi:hypothetical protein
MPLQSVMGRVNVIWFPFLGSAGLDTLMPHNRCDISLAKLMPAPLV